MRVVVVHKENHEHAFCVLVGRQHAVVVVHKENHEWWLIIKFMIRACEDIKFTNKAPKVFENHNIDWGSLYIGETNKWLVVFIYKIIRILKQPAFSNT